MQHLQCCLKLQALQSSPNERGKCRRRREKSARVAGNFVEKRAACLTVGVCMHNAASQMRCVIMLHFSGAFASAPPHSSASQGRVNCPGLRSCRLKGAQMFAAPTCFVALVFTAAITLQHSTYTAVQHLQRRRVFIQDRGSCRFEECGQLRQKHDERRPKNTSHMRRGEGR